MSMYASVSPSGSGMSFFCASKASRFICSGGGGAAFDGEAWLKQKNAPTSSALLYLCIHAAYVVNSPSSPPKFARRRREGYFRASDQFFSRYPVLNIHEMTSRQASKNPAVMLKLTATF